MEAIEYMQNGNLDNSNLLAFIRNYYHVESVSKEFSGCSTEKIIQSRYFSLVIMDETIPISISMYILDCGRPARYVSRYHKRGN